MTSKPPAQSSAGQSNSNEISIPAHFLLRHLAFKPSNGDALFPSSWTSLKLRGPIQIDVVSDQKADIAYQLQHDTHAIYRLSQKNWILRGKGNKLQVETLGIVSSKQHGARAIQLPNKTHKVVAGIVDFKDVLTLFSAPQVSQNGKKISIAPIDNSSVPFVSIVSALPELRSSFGDQRSVKVNQSDSLHHFQYVLHSRRVYKSEPKDSVGRSKLTWSDPQGTDVVDLSRFKDYLLSLKGAYEHDPQIRQLPGTHKLHFEQRLLLLEHEIDGLLKKKINFTSTDAHGTRFLDYTTILNEKENEIVALNKKIENLESRLVKSKNTENDLAAQIKRLSHALQTLKNPNVTQEQITDLLIGNSQAVLLSKQTANLKKRLETTTQVLHSHMKDLKLKGVKVENDEQLNHILQNNENIDIRIDQGIVHLIETTDKVIEKPIQDEKTHQLIRQLGNQLYRIYTKYPKVKEQANPQFIDFLHREVIKTVDNDGLSKIVEIIKYVPSVVKVENVYTYNVDKQRRVQFHLRVLLRALLDEFQRIKLKTGATPEIDEGVITMINEEISSTVNVDDILKTFQVNHKIVEVPKIVEKVVDRVVEVPIVVPVEKIVEKIVYNTKIEQVDKVIHVPIEVIKYVDKIVEKIVEVEKIKQKIVEVPKIVEKVVQKRIQIPKIVEVEVLKEKIVEVEKPVIVEKIINHAVPEIKEVQVIKHQTVVVKQIQEKIVEVQKIVEKIVERVVEKPVIVEVEKIVQKIVNTIEYRPARETVNHVEHVPQIVERIVERVVPIIQTVEKIKQVSKIVEKIVEVCREVPTIKQIKVIQQKIVYRDRIKEIEKIVEKIVPLFKQVEKIVEKRIEVPIIQQKIKIVPEIVEKIIPEKYETVRVVEVEKIVEKVVEVVKMNQVPKTVVKYITQQVPVKVIVEKIVEIPRVVQRIKEVRVHVDKIIEKMVEVPKVVEVEKIVEKIVVVPRIIEKIVEVPQIVEKIVEKIVQIEKIKEVIKQVRIPIIQQKIVQVEIIKNVPVTEIKTVEVIKEKIVPVLEVKQVIKNVDVNKEKVVEKRVEVPKEILVDKVVSHKVQVEKIVEVEKAIVIPFEVPVPCDKIVEKLVVVQKQIEKIKEVPRQTEKLVEVVKEVAKMQEVTKVEQKIVVQQKIKQVEKVVPYISEKIKEVEVIKEKPFVSHVTHEKIKQVSAYHDKIVQVVNQVPKIYQVEKIVEKIVQVPKFVEITAKEPVFITCNKIVDKFIDKVVHTNTVQQKLVQVPTVKEKIVQVHEIVRDVVQVEVNKDKIVEKEKLVTKTNVNNQIETKYQEVHTKEDKIVPITHASERLVEVPHILEKVVEKIILMPQIHEVTKHIIDIQQEANAGVSVDVEFSTHEAQYKKLYGDLKKDMDGLVLQLRAMQKSHPELSEKLKSVEAYMKNLDQVIAHPKIIQVNKDKFVNKQVPYPVLVPKRGGSDDHVNEAFYLILIEKLQKELKNSKNKANYVIEDEDLKNIFFTTIGKDEDKNISSKIAKFRTSPQGAKLLGAGDNNALVSSILYEKYHYISLLEKEKGENQRFRRIAQERLELLHQFKQTNDLLHQRLLQLQERLRTIVRQQGNNKENSEQIKRLLKEIEDLDQLLYVDIKKTRISQPVKHIQREHHYHGSQVSTKLLETRNRELEAQVELLKHQLVEREGKKESKTHITDKEIVISNLQKQISHLVQQKGQSGATLPTSLEDLTNINSRRQVDPHWNPFNQPQAGTTTIITSKGIINPQQNVINQQQPGSATTIITTKGITNAQAATTSNVVQQVKTVDDASKADPKKQTTITTVVQQIKKQDDGKAPSPGKPSQNIRKPGEDNPWNGFYKPPGEDNPWNGFYKPPGSSNAQNVVVTDPAHPGQTITTTTHIIKKPGEDNPWNGFYKPPGEDNPWNGFYKPPGSSNAQNVVVTDPSHPHPGQTVTTTTTQVINKPGEDNPWNGFYKPPGEDNPWNGFYKPPGSSNVVVKEPTHQQTTTVIKKSDVSPSIQDGHNILQQSIHHVTQQIKKAGEASSNNFVPPPGADNPWNGFYKPPGEDNPWNGFYKPPGSSNVEKIVVQDPAHPGKTVTTTTQVINKPGEDNPWNGFYKPPGEDNPWNGFYKPPGEDNPWNGFYKPPGSSNAQNVVVTDPSHPHPGQTVTTTTTQVINKPGEDNPWNGFYKPPGEDNPWNGFYKPPGEDNPWNGFYKPPGSSNVVVQDPAQKGTTVVTSETKKLVQTSNIDTKKSKWDPFAPLPATVTKSNIGGSVIPSQPVQTSTVVTQQINKPGVSEFHPPSGAVTTTKTQVINKPGEDNPWNGFYKPPGEDNPWNGFYKPPGSSNIAQSSTAQQGQTSTIQQVQPGTKVVTTTETSKVVPNEPIIVTPRKYPIGQQKVAPSPVAPSPTHSSSPPKESAIHVTHPININPLVPGSIVGRLDTSQVRPVTGASTITIPLTPGLIPFTDGQLQGSHLLNLPGRVEKVVTTDEHGNVVETIRQVGNLGPGDVGGSYQTNYLYKSQVKEEGQGSHKVQKQVTQVRTTQTVSWISRSRVLQNEPKREQSPRHDEPPKK